MHFLGNTLTFQIVKTFPIAYAFAVFEIHARFRRSLLGTFWYTLSTAIIIFGLGPLYAKIFNQSLNGYFQYIAYGIIFWNFIQGTITDATATLTQNQSYIKDLGINAIVFSVANVLKNLLIFFQNFIAVILIFLITGLDIKIPSPAILFVLLTESVLLIYVSSVIALASLRYRDLSPLITTTMQLFFFLTPILWKTRLDFQDSLVILLNPIYHLIKLPRELLTLEVFGYQTQLYIIISILPVALIAEWVNKKYSRRAIFWL